MLHTQIDADTLRMTHKKGLKYVSYRILTVKNSYCNIVLLLGTFLNFNN
jgi:hypothetical protein